MEQNTFDLIRMNEFQGEDFLLGKWENMIKGDSTNAGVNDTNVYSHIAGFGRAIPSR